LTYLAGSRKTTESALLSLLDEDVTLHAMAAGVRRLGPAATIEYVRPLPEHSSEPVRQTAAQQLRRAEKALARRPA